MLDALLPQRCPLCAARGHRGFCADCRGLLPWILIGCEICGVELPEAGVCGNCQTRRPYYDYAVIPFKYRAPVSEQIQTLKYHNQLRHAASLAAVICARAWKEPRQMPEALIPIPLHRKRLRQRGFNQALEIARSVGAELGIRVCHSLLVRNKNTASQTNLGEAERRRNVKGAFEAAGALGYAHVALVDDVVTSGNTVNTAARALKRAGVKTVGVWAAARS